jgi:hypothetical protein
MTKSGDLSELLHLFFIQNKSVSLPGVGSFDLFRVSAQSDFAAKKIFGPSYTIGFNAATDTPSRELFNYISRKRKISEWEAIRLVNEFSYHLNLMLKKGQKFVWPGIGSLESGGSAGQLVFEPERLAYDFMPAVQAKRVIRKENDHSVLVGEQEMHKSDMQQWLENETYIEERAGWWIPAIIIFAIAILVIFYCLINQNYVMQTGRQNKLTTSEAPLQYELKNGN